MFVCDFNKVIIGSGIGGYIFLYSYSYLFNVSFESSPCEVLGYGVTMYTIAKNIEDIIKIYY